MKIKNNSFLTVHKILVFGSLVGLLSGCSPNVPSTWQERGIPSIEGITRTSGGVIHNKLNCNQLWLEKKKPILAKSYYMEFNSSLESKGWQRAVDRDKVPEKIRKTPSTEINKNEPSINIYNNLYSRDGKWIYISIHGSAGKNGSFPDPSKDRVVIDMCDFLES